MARDDRHSRTRGRKRVPKPFPAEVRCAEIVRVLRHHYRGVTLPEDDAGREDARITLAHLVHLRRGDKRARNFLDLWAPWMRPDERDAMTAEAARARPPKYSADELARLLGVHDKARAALRLRTIGAVDVSQEQREGRRRAMAAARTQKHRRLKGVQPRAEYLAASKSQVKPWLAAGVSRATWYRRHHESTGPPL